MYNLLITSQDRAWEESPYFLYETSRFLEYTDDELRVQFEKLDVAAIARICAMPALFMYEEEVDEPVAILMSSARTSDAEAHRHGWFGRAAISWIVPTEVVIGRPMR